MAQLAISAAGAAIGAYFGGPVGAQIGWAAGSALGGALFPAKGPEGPRLADLKVSGSAYGTPIAYVEGHPRVAGQVIWASDKYAVTTESGGGKGGPSVETTSTIYKVDVLMLLTANEIAGIARIWSNGKLVFNARADAPDGTWDASATVPDWDAITIYGGDAAQLADPVYEAAVGSGNAPAYRGRGTVMFEGLNLGGSGIMPNLTFEVCRLADTDIAGADVVFQTSFTDNDSSDVSASAMGAANLQGNATITGNALQSLAPSSAGYSRAWWTKSPSAAAMGHAVNTAWTLEAFVTPGHIDSGYSFIIFRLDRLPSAADAFFTVSIYNSGGTYGRFAIECAGSTWDYGPSAASWFTQGVQAHVALVMPAGSPHAMRLYIDGVLAQTASAQTSLNPAFDTTGMYLWAGWGDAAYPISQEGVIGGLRKTNRELYTGSSFTPPTSFSPADVPFTIVDPLDEDLADVVERLCVRAGLDSGQVDASALVGQALRSMAVGQVTSTRGILEVLGAAYRFEAVESLGQLKFVLRGGASAATIAYASMGASRGAPVEPLPLTMLNDVETPAQMTVRYVNVSNDYQDGAESSDRLLGPGIGIRVADVPIGLTPQEARTLADIQVMDVAASQRTWGPVALSNDYAHLEPTDVVTLTDTDGSTYRGRVLRMRSGGGVHVLEGLIEDASILTSTIGTDDDYDDSTTVPSAVDTVLELLDIPLLRDEDDGPGFYAAFKGAASPWPGCTLFGSADDVTYTQIVTVTDATQIGDCTTTLGNWTGGTVFDETNSVTVDVGEQTLVSWSRDDILAGAATGYVIGDELIYAMTATLQSAGIYKLTGLLRGRRGTEWAIAGHGSGERFVALPASGRGLRRVALSSTDIGVTRYYKAVTIGRALSTATAQTLACAGVSQKPFAPVDLRADTDPGRDITLTWKRRSRYVTRFAGTGGINVPLGEESEEYEIDVLNAAGGSVVRTIAAAAAATCDYTTAMQWADFGALQTSIHAAVYQLSPSAGRGYALTQSVDVPATGAGPAPTGTRPVMKMGGILYAANSTISLSSADDGQTYTVARDDGTVQVHTYGVHFFDAQLGTQRISIGWNITANLAGMIAGTTDPADPTTDYRNDQITEPWYTHGYPRVSGDPIGVGALYSDGTYYYIVGRLADSSQPIGQMYLYRADASLVWALRGQIEQDAADPNELPEDGYGAFRSYWFTPNSTTDSIYNLTSRLQQFSGRWFLSSGSAIYYTDDATGLTGWLRCPCDLGEGDSNPPTALLDPIQVGSTLIAARASTTGDCLSKSTDNGETWATSRPIVQYGSAQELVAFGSSTALLYYTYNGLLYVASATSPFSSWSTSLVDGIAPGAGIADIVVTASGLAAWTSYPTGGGYSEWMLVYSADGITFVPATITP